DAEVAAQLGLRRERVSRAQALSQDEVLDLVGGGGPPRRAHRVGRVRRESGKTPPRWCRHLDPFRFVVLVSAYTTSDIRHLRLSPGVPPPLSGEPMRLHVSPSRRRGTAAVAAGVVAVMALAACS